MIAFKFDNCTLIQFYSYFLFYFIFYVYNFHRWWFFLFLCPFSSVHICRYRNQISLIGERSLNYLTTVNLLFKSLLSQFLFTNLKLKILNIPNLKSGNADKIPTVPTNQSAANVGVLVNALLHIYVLFYYIDSLAEGPGIARGKKIWTKFRFILAYNTPRLPMSVHEKLQLNRSSRLAGYWQHIYTNVLFYYIDYICFFEG